MRILLALSLLAASGCTWHHSRQAIGPDYSTTPADDATFVSEEDSGLTLFRVATLSEPDHYAVLVERMRRRYRCASIHHLQLDLYTDDWLILEFPIIRITAVCERERRPRAGKKTAPDKATGTAAKTSANASAGDKSDEPVRPATGDEARAPAEPDEPEAREPAAEETKALSESSEDDRHD